jgi:uncharacterized membrane protein YbhN (UPF0104 family)
MTARSARRNQIIQGVISLIVVVAIFWFVLPKIADYGEVWRTIKAMTGLEVGILVAFAAFNLWTYLPLNMSVLPGLRTGEAFVANNASTAVANTLPAGGALGIGVNFGFFRSWGFDNAAVTLALLVSGILNTFVKLGLPIIALAVLAFQGDSSGALVTAALVGVLILGLAIGLFGAMLRTDALARRIGNGLGGFLSFFVRLVRKPPIVGLGERAVGFRRQAITLLHKRGWYATGATILSHISLYLVLLISLRQVGVSEEEVSWAVVLAAFAFGRLLTAVPITPGGLGVIELGYVVALSVGQNDTTTAQITAAVLVFRALTFLPPIVIGAFCYLYWQRKMSWRHAVGTRPSLAAPSMPESAGQ